MLNITQETRFHRHINYTLKEHGWIFDHFGAQDFERVASNTGVADAMFRNKLTRFSTIVCLGVVLMSLQDIALRHSQFVTLRDTSHLQSADFGDCAKTSYKNNDQEYDRESVTQWMMLFHAVYSFCLRWTYLFLVLFPFRPP